MILEENILSYVYTDTLNTNDSDYVSTSTSLLKANRTYNNLDFIFSTDGDGDRPLVADENGEWLRGDILGLLCSKALQIEALAIPISCNTIIAQSPEFNKVALTKIGSPYVIAEFASLAKLHKTVAGFEANGGYLLGSDIEFNDKVMKALPTRDAVLPALMLLSFARQKGFTGGDHD